MCRVYSSPLLAVWMCRVYISLFVNAGMPDCPAFGQFGTEHTKMPMPQQVLYRNKGTQSSTGMLRYRTVRPDAGMQMQVASALMLMPSCAFKKQEKLPLKTYLL
jgi:hypothetical protein